MINEERQNGIHNYLENLSPDAEKEYSLRNATRPVMQAPPLMKENKWIRSDKEKAEIFAEHLAHVFHALLQNVKWWGGVSNMNVVMMKCRTNFTIGHYVNLMFINLNGSELEFFNLELYVRLWLKNRRDTFESVVGKLKN